MKMGARNVIITGGHLDPPHDLVSREDRRPPFLKAAKFRAVRLTEQVALFPPRWPAIWRWAMICFTAAKAAKHYVEAALRKALEGKGIGPIL